MAVGGVVAVVAAVVVAVAAIAASNGTVTKSVHVMWSLEAMMRVMMIRRWTARQVYRLPSRAGSGMATLASCSTCCADLRCGLVDAHHAFVC